MHTDWSTAGFDLAPFASRTSVFGTRGFLEAWWRHFGEGDLWLVEGDGALVALRQEPGGVVSFVGDEDLTDYHTPLGDAPGPLLARFLGDCPAGTRFRFDSLPGEAADALAAHIGPPAAAVRHEAAYRLALPAEFDAFLAGLSKKERHELRRKHRRFTDQLGRPRLLESTPDPVGTFVQLHRQADGPKGSFMTPRRESFFRDLAALATTRIDVLAGEDGRPVAAAFGFVDADGYYLYNSAYDPAAASASPGMVMLWLLLQSAIAAGAGVFDFLKGNEEYKLRLGARPRPLYALEGRT